MERVQHIGVIGAGTMGRGIIQLFAQAGHRVSCFDQAEGAARKAVAFARSMIERAVQKGRHTPEEASLIFAAIKPCTSLAELADCDLIIEAIVENLEVKRKLFRDLEGVVAEHAVLATNTSSLIVAEIAASCRHPERVAGLHFFNPVPLMKVVEIIAAVRTSPGTVVALRLMVEGAGHRAVVAADQPGFLVNHAGRGLYTEGLRILEEQVASPQQIDTLMREAAGFRMGPFELLDLTGLDVSGKVMASIYEQFQQEPRFRPSPLVSPRIAAGLHGRKTGAGWYRYENEIKQETAIPPVPALPRELRVWIDPLADERVGIVVLAEDAGALLVESADNADLIIIQPWGWDATRYCVDQGLDASRTVALDPLPGLSRHRTLMLTAITSPEARDAAHALMAQRGAAVTVINDSPGFVVQRVLASIVNIAAEIAQRGIASVEDIEDAVRLGLGYPQGPLSLGDQIGGARVLSILTHMQSLSGDPRYRPSHWLRRRVALGKSLLAPETPRA